MRGKARHQFYEDFAAINDRANHEKLPNKVVRCGGGTVQGAIARNQQVHHGIR